MILTGTEIGSQWESGAIRISDFDPSRITTNSYDLLLGRRIIRYTGEILDPRVNNEYEMVEIPDDGLTLQSGDFVLGETHEMIGSDHNVPLIHAKSGTARLGLFVHVTADLIDIGSYGRSTLQLFATLPVRIYHLMPIAQVTFWKPVGEITLYSGKYAGSTGPMPSLSYRDSAGAAA
ncbi:dCTP deaminase [Micromonospora chokoriensis]|uniref:dCTP deaminase n=1 Tax=Micromonospora chokoriensis TaxID=356851 RepID=UPI0004C2BB3D|nr:deoxycytidine triphosphate deaminase [Micromonospora chokoriensis]